MQQTICLISLLCKVLLFCDGKQVGEIEQKKGSMQIFFSSFPFFYTLILNHEAQPEIGCGRMIRSEAQVLPWQRWPRYEKKPMGMGSIGTLYPGTIGLFFNEPVLQSTCLMKYKFSHVTFDVHDYVILLNLWLQDDVPWIYAIVNKNQSWLWQNSKN